MLRNACIPIVTYLGIELTTLLAGSVVTEGVFNLGGVGGELFSAVRSQSGAVVVGFVSMIVLLILALNIVIDVLYSLIDPRVRRV